MNTIKFIVRLLVSVALCAQLAMACSDDPPLDNDDATAGHEAGAPADAGADGSGQDAGKGALAVGQFKDYPADAKGVVAGSIAVGGSAQFLLLLTSSDISALKVHNYSASQPTGGSAAFVAPPPGTPLPAHRCQFSARLRRVLASARGRLRRAAPHAFATAPPQKGDKRQFNITAGGLPSKITAEALHVDGAAAIWIDRSTTPAASITPATLKLLAEGFSKVVVPRMRTYFGRESDLDGDGHISLLYSPLVTQSASAYFSPCDLVDPKLVPACANGNRMELLYMSPPSSLPGPYAKPTALLETAAHELQHLIYFNRKYVLNNNTTASENPYITEGLSHLAQDLSGYQSSNLFVLASSLKGIDTLSVPNMVSSKIYSYVDGPYDGIMRGGGYLLMRYLFDQAGGDAMDSAGKPVDRGGIAWLHKYMDRKELGLANLSRATSLPLDQLSTQFWTAVALSNRGANNGPINTDPRYNYRPTTKDPITGSSRGCDLFAEYHGFKIGGPGTQSIDFADGLLRGGGAELLELYTTKGQKRLSFRVATPPAAKALGRLIRVY